MHLAPLIYDLAVILAVAGMVALVFQKIRQPVVLGYIIAGFVVGPYTSPIHLVSDIPTIQTWAELGVIFLMFSLGLEFSFRKLAQVGLSAALTAGFEVSCMLGLGFLTGRLLGWPRTDSIFLGAMIAISSTTILVKALDELGLKTRRFSQMIFGVLVVEDLLAILVLVALSTMAASKGFSGLDLLKAAGQLVLVIVSWFVAGYFVVPRFVRYVGKIGSNEMLTICSLALCLALVVFAAHFQYSTALGAFIMGSILAESTESHRIEESIEPLRDLFSAIFFVSVGMLIDPHAVWEQLPMILLLSSVLVAGKVIFTTVGALLTGQTLRMAVQVGFGLAQIGEFSFIIAGLGVALKLTGTSLYPVAVAVSIITTFTTPYMIRISHKTAVALEGRLPLRVRNFLTQYVVWTQERRADAGRREDFFRRAFRWLINGVITTVIFVLSAELLAPWVGARFRVDTWMDSRWASVLSWSAAVLLSAPSIWAMLNAFTEFRLGATAQVGQTKEQEPRGGTLLLMRLLTLSWLGVLSVKFLPLQWVAALTGGTGLLLLLLFHRQLGASYAWFERRFLSTFQPAEKSLPRNDVLKHLAPWDAHLVRIKVHPNADIVAKTLGELGFRSKHSLNVVAIQRGLKTIVAPTKNVMIFPKDELLVLGTDEKLDFIRPWIERPPGLDERFRRHISGYEVRPILLEPGSYLIGKSIRESQLQEEFEALVVGVERGNTRILNPDPLLPLAEGDSIWVVGQNESLNRLSLKAVPKT